jgi:hypothetical protein
MKLSEIIPPKPASREYLPLEIDEWNDFYSQLLANIEALEKSAVRVTGAVDKDGRIHLPFGDMPSSHDTHRGLLICVEPLDSRVPLSEVIEILRKRSSKTDAFTINGDLLEMADRLQKHGVKE